MRAGPDRAALDVLAGVFGRFLDAVHLGRGGAAGAVPRGLAPRAGGGLLIEEGGEVEGGFGGRHAHGSSFRDAAGRRRGAKARPATAVRGCAGVRRGEGMRLLWGER